MRMSPLVASLIAFGTVAAARPTSAQPEAPSSPFALPYPHYSQPIAPGPRLRYEPGKSPLPGYYFEQNPRKGFVISVLETPLCPVFDSAFQTTRAMLFAAGFVFPKKEWVSDYEAAARGSPSFSWSITPRIDAEGRVGINV